MKRGKNIIGQKFGKLLVMSLNPIKSKSRNLRWNCICDCGNFTASVGSSLRNGSSTSCGCYTEEQRLLKITKHGFSKTETYKTWEMMIQRCTNKNYDSYEYYGGRGVTYTPYWESFENFLEDMGERPEGTTLDRINNNKGYFKENCRWVNKTVQQFNQNTRRDNTSGRVGVYFYNGKWSASISKENIKYHLGYFNSFEEAVKAREKAEIEYYGYIKGAINA